MGATESLYVAYKVGCECATPYNLQPYNLQSVSLSLSLYLSWTVYPRLEDIRRDDIIDDTDDLDS